MIDNNQKEKWTQDELYEFLTNNDVIITRLGDLMGMTISMVASNFKHHVTRHGKPRSFNYQQVIKLNGALQQMAMNMRKCLLRYAGTEQKKGNLGKIYYPVLREQMNDGVGQYFNLVALTNRVLGWNRTKKRNVLECNRENSKVSGCITGQEAELINKEILAVAGMLESHEIVCTTANNGEDSVEDTNPNVSPRRNHPRSEQGRQKAAAYGSRRRSPAVIEKTFENNKYPWDDTKLSMIDRSRLLHEQWPNGMLLFRVDGGYTAEGEDALYISNVDKELKPFSDSSSGLTTLFMGRDAMARILSRFIEDGKRVVITDMYDE